MSSEVLNQNNSTETLKLTPEGEAAALTVTTTEDHVCGEHCDHSPVPATKPAQMTRKQIGQLRRQYFTVTHGTVKACGHKAKFSATKQPANNCVDCWTAFFATNVDLLGVHKLLTDKGVRGLEKQYGTKFMRNFHGFLALYLKEQRDAETNPQEAVII
jgi:hypothetical protein